MPGRFNIGAMWLCIVMREYERAGRGDSKREMLRLKTPSVGKLFNYLRYCWGRSDGGAEIRCESVRRRNKGLILTKKRENEEKAINERLRVIREKRLEGRIHTEFPIRTEQANLNLCGQRVPASLISRNCRVSLKKFNCTKCD